MQDSSSEPATAAPGVDSHGVPTLSDEAAARRALRRNRALASGLLALMLIVYAGTWFSLNPGFWIGLLRAGSQAGIVGGLADWFAVTAIFRHPLGVPVPHTAVLPRNKDRIGRSLGSFVERSFLTEAVLMPRLRAARPGRRAAEWLSRPESAKLIVDPIVSALPEVMRALDTAELREFLTRVVGEQLREVNLAPLLGRTLEVLTQSGEADVLFDRGIEMALAWLDANQGEIDELVQQRSHWWVPRVINRGIAHRIFAGLTDVLNGLQQHDSETRRRFHGALESFIDRLMNSPEQSLEVNAARDRLLRHPELQAWINAVWTELSLALSSDIAETDSRTREVLEKALLSVGRALARDEPMQAKIDEALERLAERLLSYRGEIGRFMAEVIRSWDAETLAERLELVIGSDLQYIRMNGTVVGCLVGCAIYLVTWA